MMRIDWRSRARRYWRNDIRPLLVLLLVVGAVRSSLADWNDVPTGSMKPTIVEGDRIFINKLAYDLKIPFTTWRLVEWDNPKRGDIVVFYSPADGKRLVKRIIGVPGDSVEMRNQVLLINGEPVSYSLLGSSVGIQEKGQEPSNGVLVWEDLPSHPHAVIVKPEVPGPRTFPPMTVPAGEFFTLGDNRDDSFDSRFWGCVSRDRILGQAEAVVFSLDRESHWRPRSDRWLKKLN